MSEWYYTIKIHKDRITAAAKIANLIAGCKHSIFSMGGD